MLWPDDQIKDGKILPWPACNGPDYARGWNAAIGAVVATIRVEADACLSDIVDGDEIGKREAEIRASALLTVVDDILAMMKK